MWRLIPRVLLRRAGFPFGLVAALGDERVAEAAAEYRSAVRRFEDARHAALTDLIPEAVLAARRVADRAALRRLSKARSAVGRRKAPVHHEPAVAAYEAAHEELFARAGCLEAALLPVWNVNSLSLRQYLTDTGLLGRISATARTISWATVPLSALLGGVFAQVGVDHAGDRRGLAIVLALGGVLWSAATLTLPIRRLSAVRRPQDAARIYGRATEAAT